MRDFIQLIRTYRYGCLAVLLCCWCSGSLSAASVASQEGGPKKEGAQPSFLSSGWSVKTNLLHDALLLPSLEVEYRFQPRWTAAVEANIAWWERPSRHRYYQLAVITPEVRYWIFRPDGKCAHYFGLMAGGGWYDLSSGRQGYQGEGFIAGLTYGCQFPIGRRLSLESGFAYGFVTTSYEEYKPDKGHYVYQQTHRANFWGPVRMRLALVWHLPLDAWMKGGSR